MKKNESGASILLVLTVLTILAVFTGVAMDLTMSVGKNVKRTNNMQAAIAIANGALDEQFAYWREICRATPSSQRPTSAFTSIPLPTSSQFPYIPNFTASAAANTSNSTHTIASYKIVALDPQLKTIGNGAAPPAATGMNATATSYFYMGSADVTLPDISSTVSVKVRRIFQKQQLSPWNWAIFYVDPLEIHPSPLFTVTGWVHTNSDLYTGHDTLTFADKATYANSWTVGFAPGDSTHSETPVAPNYPTNLPPALEIAHQPFGMDSSRVFSTTDASDNDDGYHELVERPDPGYSDPIAAQRYYDQAGAKILIDASNNVTIMNQNGTVLTGNGNPLDKAIYTTFSNAITTNSSIQDNREGATVRLVNVDVSQITTALTTGPLANKNFNQIVYISDTSAGQTGGSPKRGVRLKNGSALPVNGLTFASDNPVYIQGDYNTGALPPSNLGTYTQPTGTGYTKQPSSIVADAVSVLSNAWVDANSFSSLSSRIASNTTVNTAIIAGIVPSANGNYSGGAENYPRFLEDWTNKSLTYYGSMVELYQSQQATGIWGKSNVYSPPLREWFFDTDFQTNTPPGSIMIVNYMKQRWFQQ